MSVPKAVKMEIPKSKFRQLEKDTGDINWDETLTKEDILSLMKKDRSCCQNSIVKQILHRFSYLSKY